MKVGEWVVAEGVEEGRLKANDTQCGLAAAVWTRDIKKAHRIASERRAGTAWLNCYGVPAMPLGGHEQSGSGREMGHQMLDLYTETESVCALIS